LILINALSGPGCKKEVGKRRLQMTQSVTHLKQSGAIRGVTGGPRQVVDLAGRLLAVIALLARALVSVPGPRHVLDRNGDPVEQMGAA
jgi:hypothetical protein